MSRGKHCTICASTDRGQIDALIASGIKLKEIAAQIPGVSKFALSRHKRNCVTPASAPPTGDSASLESQLAVWLQRSEDLYHAGGVSLDLRAQAQAIQSAFRALEVARKNQERAEETREEKDVSDGDAPLTLAALDAIIAEYDSNPRNEGIEQIRHELQSADLKLFPSLVQGVLIFIRDFKRPVVARPAELESAPVQPAQTPKAEEVSFLQCPHCQSRCVSTTNGYLRCGTCGKQEQLPAGIRLKPQFPNHWMQKETASA